jgi:uncharacterized SAM-binding protein YcdF (DUF218 family)
MIFFIKKLVSRLLFPVPLCAELLVIGLILLLFTKRQKLAKVFLIAATALFLAISLPLLPPLAMAPLERQYPAVFPINQEPATANREPRTANFLQASSLIPHPSLICVLGQGVSANTNLPANARFTQEFLPRLIEAARLQKATPGSTILVSIAGKVIPEPDKTKVLAEFYSMFGITTNQFAVYGDALDTVSEIQFFKTKAGTNRVFLVSSASHLPRAMLLARRYQLDAVPAGGGYQADETKDTKSPFDPSSLFPNAGSIFVSERAVYEYMGLAFEKLKGVPTTNGPQ